MHQSDIQHSKNSLREKLERLFTMRGGAATALNSPHAKIDLTIRPVYFDVLKALGDPHLHLPPVIHVAGTNGKGSVIAMMRAMFEAHDLKIHQYTSPHLIKFNERIVLAGREINDDELELLIDEVLAVQNIDQLTFFEATTALAFLAFSRVPADVVLLETGLGGRLDCTNIVPKPAVSAITKIGLDHTEFLGSTLPLIAFEKAGIMKENVPCIVMKQSSAGVMDVFEKRAQDLPCPLLIADYSSARDGALVSAASLQGAHQRQNALVAHEAVLCFQKQHDFGYDREKAMSGLAKARWPARLQKLTRGQKDLLIPKCGVVWLDGGHNEDAAKALAAQIKSWKAQSADTPLSVTLIAGLMRKKDIKGFLNPFLPEIDRLIAIGMPDERDAYNAPDLAAAMACITDMPVETVDDVAQLPALFCRPDEVVFFAGSFYLAGRVLSYLKF